MASEYSYKRADRVGPLIREALTDIILRRIKDPRVKGVMITAVDVSPDLRSAKVFYSFSGPDPDAGALGVQKGLEKAAPFIRRLLGQEVRLRRLPDLTFHFDESLRYGESIDRILHHLQEEAPVGDADADDAAEGREDEPE